MDPISRPNARGAARRTGCRHRRHHTRRNRHGRRVEPAGAGRAASNRVTRSHSGRRLRDRRSRLGRHCAPGLHALALRRRGHRRHQLPGHPARGVGPRSHQRSRCAPDPRRRVRRRLLRPVRRIGEQCRPTRRDARRQRVEVDQRGGAPLGAEGALPPAHRRNADRRRARSDAGARRRLPRWSPPRRPSRAPRG